MNHRLTAPCAPAARKRGLFGLLALVLGGLAICVAAGASHAASGSQPKTTATKVAESAEPPIKTYGSKSAPITLETYSDFQCPSCRAFYEGTLRPLIANYVAAGKVYLIHHDFPLPIHKYGYEAARWANAAARVGEFPQVEAALYDNQDSWGADGNIQKYVSGAMSASDFKRVEKLMQGCADQSTAGVQPASQSTHSCPEDFFIESDRALGMQVPVMATPTFVIYYKGQKISSASGVISWPILKQFFDQLLKQ